MLKRYQRPNREPSCSVCSIPPELEEASPSPCEPLSGTAVARDARASLRLRSEREGRETKERRGERPWKEEAKEGVAKEDDAAERGRRRGCFRVRGSWSFGRRSGVKQGERMALCIAGSGGPVTREGW